jgi:glycosyltransferase involved in cell wall biosynthesis
LTGHCAYSYDCARWKTGCGDCPYPKESPAIRRDATHLEWRLKKRSFLRASPYLVSKCGWTTRMVNVSALRHLPLTEIPYGVDTDVFRPLEKIPSREVLGLPPDRLVLHVSAEQIRNRRGGADLLARALDRLPPDISARALVLATGKYGSDVARQTGLPVRDLGHLADDRLRALACSAADLFLFPTRADVCGLSSIESQACGTPVISFRVGGVPDYVRPGETGFLAEPEDALGFRDGIALLLEDPDVRRRMSETCRKIAVTEYDLNIETRRHVELYDSVLRETGAPAAESVLVPPDPGAAARITTHVTEAASAMPVALRGPPE